MHWRLKRQLIAIGVFGLLIALIMFALFFWFRTPLRDTGPPLPIAAEPLRLLWTRFFFVRPGVYDIAALLENPNDRAQAVRISYIFRLFDESDILIAAKEGIGFVNSGERFVITEPFIATAVRIPKRVSFEIRNVAWNVKEKIISPIVVKEKGFATSGIDTTVHVVLFNSEVTESLALEAISVLVDKDGNAMAVARAIIDPLAGGEERDVVFTWPRVLLEPKAIQVYVREKSL